MANNCCAAQQQLQQVLLQDEKIKLVQQACFSTPQTPTHLSRLPLGALQEVRVVADLAQHVNARQRGAVALRVGGQAGAPPAGAL